MAWFENWFDSPYYHLLYQHRNDAEAQAFMLNLIAHLQIPNKARLLDLACGKGRHARFLANNGFDVTGIDLSKNSIRHAMQFERENLAFFTHDMRKPFRSNYFDYVFNIFTSFGYFERDSDHLKTLQQVHQELKPNGFFVLDYFNLQYVAANLVPFEEKNLAGVEFGLTRFIDELQVVKRINVRDGEKNYEFEERVRAFTKADFEQLLSRAGFSLVEVFGSYKLENFDANTSPRLIFLAQK